MTENFGSSMARVGLLFIIGGILIDLVFSEWTTIFLVGILFFVPEITGKLIHRHWDGQEFGPDLIPLLQPNQEEI
jgi:hypothetical protein